MLSCAVVRSVALLSEVGWDYVKIMKTLAYLSPKSYFTYTFDKMYLFGMVEYKRVIFFDADMLCTGNPDSMFDVNLPSVKYVGAIGGMGSSYFQTGARMRACARACLWVGVNGGGWV